MTDRSPRATDFFRQEVVRHRQRGAIGSARLVAPLSARLLTAFVVAVAVGVGTWLATSFHTRKIHPDGCVSPDTSHVELFATAATVGSLRADQTVRFRYPSLPAETAPALSGAIVAVSSAALVAGELASVPAWIASRASNEPVYRVTARLDTPPPGESRPAAGIAVDADVRIDRRRLVAWLFAPRARGDAPV